MTINRSVLSGQLPRGTFLWLPNSFGLLYSLHNNFTAIPPNPHHHQSHCFGEPSWAANSITGTHRHLYSPASNGLSFTEPILQNNGGSCRNHRLQRLNQSANSQLSECRELSQTPLKHFYRSSKETFTTHLPHSHSAQDVHTIQAFQARKSQ